MPREKLDILGHQCTECLFSEYSESEYRSFGLRVSSPESPSPIITVVEELILLVHYTVNSTDFRRQPETNATLLQYYRTTLQYFSSALSDFAIHFDRPRLFAEAPDRPREAPLAGGNFRTSEQLIRQYVRQRANQS